MKPALPHLIVGGKQCGKTTAVIQWMKEGEPADNEFGWSRLMVVPTIERARELGRLYPKLAKAFVTPYFMRRISNKVTLPYAIDDLDMILRNYMGRKKGPVMMTASWVIERLHETSEPPGRIGVYLPTVTPTD